jgi:NAD(P)-dependent dehydrogenase (short-subunit alcohol dehydrogenase family)
MKAPPVTIVTGGGRGIGRAIAIRMARDTVVVLVGRSETDLAQTQAVIAENGGMALSVAGDIADPDTARETALVCSAFTVRNLILNAGIGKTGATASFDADMWERIFAVNVHGAFHCIKAFLPHMIRAGAGTICLMSSVAGVAGVAEDAPYTASKHALVGLARTLAREYGKHGIVTVAICPGFVAGDMTERSIAHTAQRLGISITDARRRIEKINPQGRIIPPEEVAEMIAFVCSGTVPSLSGSSIVLNGGGYA